MKRLLPAFSYSMIGFIYLPMLILVIYSFNSARINAVWSGFTFDWYLSLFQNKYVLEALANSLTIAFANMIISTIVGTMTAFAFYRYVFRFDMAWKGLIYFPILIPELLMGLSLLLMFTQLNMPLGKLTLLIAHITFSIPFVYMIVVMRLEDLGDDLVEAAQDLGANTWQTFRRVTFPSISSSVFAAAILVFTLSLDDFIISFFVAGPNSTTLPIYIYGMIKRGITPEINALAALMITVTVILVMIGESLRKKGSNNYTPFY